MSLHSSRVQSGPPLRRAVALCLAACFTAAASHAASPPGGQQQMHGGMAHMAGHMYLTSLRPVQPGDQEKADAVVAAAKKAMAPYEDYHKALADGYRIFLPNVPQAQYHFTKYENGRDAWL